MRIKRDVLWMSHPRYQIQNLLGRTQHRHTQTDKRFKRFS